MILDQMEAGRDQARPDSTARPAPLHPRRGRLVCSVAWLLAIWLAQIAQADPIPTADKKSPAMLQDPTDGEYYDDHDADYPDDGSRALPGKTGFTVPKGLLPIDPIEEEGLLGDWGDSDEEAED